MNPSTQIGLFTAFSFLCLLGKYLIKGKNDPLTYLMFFYFFFTFGPIVNYLFGIPIYFVGVGSFWLVIILGLLIVITIIIFFIKDNDPNTKSCKFCNKDFTKNFVILIMVLLTQHIFFVSFNIVSGHMWFTSSIRSLFAWDACYDNSIWLDSSKTSNNDGLYWIELIVYINYWIP